MPVQPLSNRIEALTDRLAFHLSRAGSHYLKEREDCHAISFLESIIGLIAFDSLLLVRNFATLHRIVRNWEAEWQDAVTGRNGPSLRRGQPCL